MRAVFPLSSFGGLGPVSNFFDDMDSIFDGMLTHRAPTPPSRSLMTTTPRANILKLDNGYSIELAVPGFTRDEFNITVDDGVLSVSVSSEDTEKYVSSLTSREYSYTSFKRSWTLPSDVNLETIDARYEAGILTVSVPTLEKNESTLKIEVG